MNKSFFYRIDWIVIFCYLSLVFFGLVNIYSSTNYNEINNPDGTQNITNQLNKDYELLQKEVIQLQRYKKTNPKEWKEFGQTIGNKSNNTIWDDQLIQKEIEIKEITQKLNNLNDSSISLNELTNKKSLAGKHFIIFSFSIILGFFILFIRTQFFQQLSYLVYFASILSLIGLFVFGETINSANSWYVIKGISIQPSELAKIGTIFALARHLSDFNTDITKIQSFFKGVILILIPSLLIVLQPDPGSAIIFGCFFLIFFREGLSFNYLIISIIGLILFISTLLINFNYIIIFILCFSLFILFISIRFYKKTKILPIFIFMISSITFVLSVNFIFNSVFEQRHRDRFNVMLGLIEDTKGLGYNINQSKIAIGSGGFSGKGFLQGTQTKGDFVPEQQTDYIFSTVGEEWGFIGSFGLIIVFVILIIRMLNQAEKQTNIYRRTFIYGISSLFFSHFTINIGMSLGLFPTVGIPLPFISSGGSSLLAFSLLIFIYLNFDANRLNHW